MEILANLLNSNGANITVLLNNIIALVQNDGWKNLIMMAIGGILIYLAIAKDMEPTLLLPMGFGTIIVNAVACVADATGAISGYEGALTTLFQAGIANELFPLILFIGIGAMIDFGPILTNPKLMVFGAAAQFGIFMTFALASLFFPLEVAASIGIIGAADGPTAIVVAQKLITDPNYLHVTAAIMVAAYSYMALVPIIQPPVIKALTTKKERLIRMPYRGKQVSRLTKILFPIIITIVGGVVAPESIDLIGFLMFGNLIRECGVLNSLSDTASKVLANLITIFLGITIATQMTGAKFLQLDTLLILGLGLFAFVFDTAGGVLFAKLLNLFLKEKINPMIGASGISAFPMSGRVVHKMGLKEDSQNHLLMQSIGVNVSGQIASVIAGGMILAFFA
ncbi:MAG: sodium ion-translocating decarboxylase subunit beta [Clostridia bacterium]|nr:sodium ion-translocating decarboxylase subunit beta [Clostridia bacterium]